MEEVEPTATEPTEPIRAAGVIIKAASTGRVLMLHRVDGQGWSWPAGGLEPGETPEQAAYRETFEETGFRLGSVGRPLMRSNKGGVSFCTFITTTEDEFTPKLNGEHDAFMWTDPRTALAEADDPDDAIDPYVAGMIADSVDLLEARMDSVEQRLSRS